MSTPIRRTTTRLALGGAMALGSAGLLAGPALAQDPYPPPSIDVTVTTPGATIEVEGSGWGPGTTVTITRKRGNNADGGTEKVTATVAEDGTFEAPVEVPEDAGGTEIQYEVSGVDEQGGERTELRALNVQMASAEMAPDADTTELAAPATPDDGGDTGLIVGLSAAGLAAVAGGSVVARRRANAS